MSARYRSPLWSVSLTSRDSIEARFPVQDSQISMLLAPRYERYCTDALHLEC